MKDGLIRQRRNLIATSVVLTLFDFAKVTVGKVSVLGTNLIVGNPVVVIGFLWAMWAYFLLRFLQYLAEESDLGIASAFKSKSDDLIKPHIEGIMARQSGERQYSNYGPDFIEKRGLLTWQQPIKFYNVETSSVEEVGREALPKSTVALTILRSLVHVLVFTPRGTDYVLPFLLALAAPLVTWCA